MLVEEHLISLHFLAGSLPISLAEQPKASSCCLASPGQGQGWCIGDCDGRGEAHAGALTHCSAAASHAAASASSLPSLPASLASHPSKAWKLNYI